MRPGKRAAPLLGAAVLLGVMVAPVAVSAQSTGGSGLSPAAPQVLTTGYESPDDLRNDAVHNASGEQYSAWLVESSRFVGVAFGGFMPDHAGPDVAGQGKNIDFPLDVGIIKGKRSKIT